MSTQRAATTAFDEIYRAHAPRLVAFAFLLCGSRPAAEDLLHDVFVAAGPRLAQIDDAGAYLRRSVINASGRWRQREQRRLEQPPGPAAAPAPEHDGMLELLWQLPHRQRTALVLRFYEDLPIDAIAAITGQRPSTVRSQIHRGLAKLKERIAIDE